MCTTQINYVGTLHDLQRLPFLNTQVLKYLRTRPTARHCIVELLLMERAKLVYTILANQCQVLILKIDLSAWILAATLLDQS